MDAIPFVFAHLVDSWSLEMWLLASHLIICSIFVLYESIKVWINNLLQCNVLLVLITNQGHHLLMTPICVVLAWRTHTSSSFAFSSHTVCWVVFWILHCIHLFSTPIALENISTSFTVASSLLSSSVELILVELSIVVMMM